MERAAVDAFLPMAAPDPCPVCAAPAASPYGEKAGHRLFRCPCCGLLFVAPMPSDETLAAFYHDYAKTAQYAAKLDSKVRRAKRRIRALRRRVSGRRLLDAGCNAGFATEAARSLGFRALGVDLDPVAVAAAGRLFPAARFLAEDVAVLAKRGDRFDAVYCSEVIEHLPRPLPFLGALRRMLAPGGRALFTTPDMGHRSLPNDLLATEMIRPPEHLLYFDRSSAARALRESGFARVRFLRTFKPTLKILAW